MDLKVEEEEEKKVDFQAIELFIAQRIESINFALIRSVSLDLQTTKPNSVSSVNEMTQFKLLYKLEDIRNEASKLEKNYKWHLQIRGDGNCFYRSIIILYLGRLFESSDLLIHFINQVYSLNNIESSLTSKGINCDDLKAIFLGFLMFLLEVKREGKVDNFQDIIQFYNYLLEVDMAAIVITRFMIYQQFVFMKNDPLRKLFIEEKIWKEGQTLILTYFECAEDIIISLAASAFNCNINVQHFYRALGEKKNQSIVSKYEQYKPHLQNVQTNICVLFLNGHYEALIEHNQDKFYQLQYFNRYIASDIIRNTLFFQVFNRTPSASLKYINQRLNKNNLTSSSVRPSIKQTIGLTNSRIIKNDNPNLQNQQQSKKDMLSPKQTNNQIETRIENQNTQILEIANSHISEVKDSLVTSQILATENDKFNCRICFYNANNEQIPFLNTKMNVCGECMKQIYEKVILFNRRLNSQAENPLEQKISPTETNRHNDIASQNLNEANKLKDEIQSKTLNKNQMILESFEKIGQERVSQNQQTILYLEGISVCLFCKYKLNNQNFVLTEEKEKRSFGVCLLCIQDRLSFEEIKDGNKVVLNSKTFKINDSVSKAIQNHKDRNKQTEQQLKEQNARKELSKDIKGYNIPNEIEFNNKLVRNIKYAPNNQQIRPYSSNANLNRSQIQAQEKVNKNQGDFTIEEYVNEQICISCKPNEKSYGKLLEIQWKPTTGRLEKVSICQICLSSKAINPNREFEYKDNKFIIPYNVYDQIRTLKESQEKQISLRAEEKKLSLVSQNKNSFSSQKSPKTDLLIKKQPPEQRIFSNSSRPQQNTSYGNPFLQQYDKLSEKQKFLSYFNKQTLKK